MALRPLCLLLRFSNLLDHLDGRARFVNAERLLGEEIAGGGKSARPASHTHVTKFAAPALPFQVVVVTQLVKYDRVGPDIGKTLFAQIASEGGQVTTRKDLSFVGDEAHTRTREAAFCHGIHIARMSAGVPCVSYGRPAARLQRDAG